MTHIPVKLPDTMTRADVGPYLAELRGHFGLNEQDVSDRLHIRVRYLRALEVGDFTQLPTVVYARGYLHTYAEFLGLDADQVVERCFGEEPSAPPLPILPRTTAARGSFQAAQWRSGAMLAVGVAIVILIGAQFYGHREKDAPEPVAAVPEEVLGVMRTMFMPTGLTRDCLNGNGWSPCMAAMRNWQSVSQMQHAVVHYEVAEMPSPFALALTMPTTPLAEVPEESAAETEKKPAKPKASDDASEEEAH